MNSPQGNQCPRGTNGPEGPTEAESRVATSGVWRRPTGQETERGSIWDLRAVSLITCQPITSRCGRREKSARVSKEPEQSRSWVATRGHYSCFVLLH